LNEQAAKQPIDDLLLAFLREPGEAESEAALEQLLCDHAHPLIKTIISFKLRAHASGRNDCRDEQEVEDVSQEVILRLVRALRQYKSSPQEKNITSLRSYVAATAYNASDDYVRQKYPRRFSLKNRIKYILTHQPGLGLWESENKETQCGYERWRQSKHYQAKALGLDQIRNEFGGFLQKRFAGRALDRVNPAEVVSAVFDLANGPLELDELVGLMAEVWGVRDAPPLSVSGDASFAALNQLSSDPRQQLDEAVDHSVRLVRVWDEILQLPIRQRAALLLNLRDEQGGAAITLLPILRLATIEQIAVGLEISAEEMAEVWNDLPLEDAAIAERLGATRQQVINLRKCARARLARRLASRG
jgi:RNA polymerase sigma factor (sigma-70 family)